MKTFLKLTTYSVVLLTTLLSYANAQATDFSMHPNQENERRLRNNLPRQNASLAPTHTISVDLFSFVQNFDLEIDQGPITTPRDAFAHGMPFHRKLNPWKLLYKYNFSHTASSAAFLRAGILGFYRRDRREANTWYDRPELNHWQDFLFASYGGFLGIERAYTLIPALNFTLSVDLGYYTSIFRREDQQGHLNITDSEGWTIGHFAKIQEVRSWAHSFFLLPSIGIEYTFLNRFALGVSVNVKMRYFRQNNNRGRSYMLHEDGRIEHLPNTEFGRMPVQLFSVGLTPSIYFSYKF